VDPNGRKSPETYLPTDDLQRRQHPVPWKTIEAPAA
jgi:hypothetical protein